MSKSRPVIDFGKEVYHVWITERPSTLAAALAYYGMFSLAPLIYVAFSVAGIVLDEASVANQFFDRLEFVMGAETAQFVQDAVYNLQQTSTGGSYLWSIISFLALLFAASGMFFQLQYALNTVWNVPAPERGETKNFIRQRLFSFLMVIGVGLLLIIMAVASLLMSWITSLLNIDAPGMGYTLLAFLAVATVSFALIYKILPNISISWKDVWIGAAVTAVMITIGGLIIGFYLSRSSASSALQAAGSVAVVLLGIRYMAQIFLVGAVFTRVYAHMFGSLRQLDGELNDPVN
jgi:membrane protein